MSRTVKPPISPRKEPKQERSQSMIDAVMEATTRILTTMGAEKTTTNKVAELAGISVGSLYQYFPNKDAVFAKLIERHLAHHKEVVVKILEENVNQPTDLAIEKIMSHMVGMYLSKKKILKPLMVHIPRLEKTRDTLLMRNEVIDVIAAYLESRRSDLVVTDIRASLVILVNSVMGVMTTMLFSETELMSPEAMTAELSVLAKRYLMGK